MHKSEFVAVAEAIKDCKDALIASAPSESRQQILRSFQGMANDIAKVLARQNAKFDRARFLTSCGMGQ